MPAPGAASSQAAGSPHADDGGGQAGPGEALSGSPRPSSARGPAGHAKAHRGPLIRLPLPSAGSATAGYVEGYPRSVLPQAPRSVLTSTSVTSDGDRLQAALTATSTVGGARVLRFYRLHLARLGFVESPTNAMGGSEAAAFRRGPDSVTVTVTHRDQTAYTIYGTLRGT